MPADRAMYTYDYPRPAVTTDIILFTFTESELRVLLVQRGSEPFAGQWALPGGFAQMDEPLEATARRELAEETGVDEASNDFYIEQLYTFGAPERDPRGRIISVAYFALLSVDRVGKVAVRGGDDTSDARWWRVDDVPPLAFDHDNILRYALRRLRWKLEWTALGFLLLPRQFTLSELQRVYEAVLGETLDKRNFRRKMLATRIEGAPILEETGEVRQGGHRPAKLYRFTARAVELERVRRRFP